jgi:TfoX/Sxy family transcriptional regulator of competence genes
MAWKKAPDWLVEAFGPLVPEGPVVERRKMFGYPCAFAAGNMFIGLHEDHLILRLPDGERERFQESYRAEIFQPFPGRLMREYVVVPHSLVRDPEALEPWVARSAAYAASLPPKGAKGKGAKRKAGVKKASGRPPGGAARRR